MARPNKASPVKFQNVVDQKSSRTAKNLNSTLDKANTKVAASIKNTRLNLNVLRLRLLPRDSTRAPATIRAQPPAWLRPSFSCRNNQPSRKVNRVEAWNSAATIEASS